MGTAKFEISPEYRFTAGGPSFAVGRLLNDPPPPKTISIDCDTIFLNKKDLEISFKLESAKMENFDRLIINGVTFVREKING